ncbi:aminotransferase class I/II-fold pyridoxal phosphate-dependent enzyme [Planctomycetota bacterium]
MSDPDHKHINYLEYARTRMAGSKYLLAGSGIPTIPLEEFDLDLNELTSTLDLKSTTYGRIEVLESLSDYYDIPVDNILPTLGTSQGIFHLMAALLEPGDEVIVEHPYYESLAKVPQFLGGHVKFLRRRLENNWHIDLEEIKSLLSPKTKVICLSSLHNPTGVFIPEKTLSALSELAYSVNAEILIDEVYLDMMLDCPLPRRGCQIADNITSIGSFTKCWGLGPNRTGWIFARPEIIRTCGFFSNFDNVQPPYLSDAFLVACLKRKDQLNAIMHSTIEQNMPILQQWAQTNPDLPYVPPDGGLMFFFKLPAGMSSQQLLQLCLEKYDTSFSPGSFFDANDFIRLAGGTDRDNLQSGLARITAAITDLRQ